MERAGGSAGAPEGDMSPSSGPWCRKPLWVVEMQSRGDTLAAAPSVEMAPLASPGKQKDSSTDTWLGNEGRELSLRRSPSPGRHSSSPQRHLTLLDLLSIGIGGTVGSGIFVLCGLVAHSYAGPATAVSFAIAGLAAAASGCCYAELASKIPASGSTYAFSFVTIGELAAVISAALLTLEYGVSGSAVARSWGDKVMEYIISQQHAESGSRVGRWMIDTFSGSSLNPLAFMLSIAATITLLSGVKESKRVVNSFTIIKLLLVAFMITLGFVYSRRENWTPFPPPEFGVAGIFRGATSSFFAFLGFDEVVCLAGESINPKRDLPPSVLLTIAGVSIVYILAAFSLTGMQPYGDISEASGFPEAFRKLGLNWAANIAALGEIVCLPLVVLICLLAQPRLLQALAHDELLPPLFGNLQFGTLCSGIAMALIALFVPFTFLDDFVSAGVLLAFCITNNAVALLRASSHIRNPSSCDERRLFERELASFNTVAFGGAFFLCYSYFYASILPIFAVVVLAIRLGKKMTKAQSGDGFEAPTGLPFVAIFINAVLIFQLEPLGLGILFCFVSLCALLYFWSSGSQGADAEVKHRWSEAVRAS